MKEILIATLEVSWFLFKLALIVGPIMWLNKQFHP